jgi:hypothetical protein
MTGKGEDGFDFQVTNTTTEIEFSILVDKFEHPEKIRIGAKGQRAPGVKFLLPVTSPDK